MDIIQYNVMHTFVRVLDNPRNMAKFFFFSIGERNVSIIFSVLYKVVRSFFFKKKF